MRAKYLGGLLVYGGVIAFAAFGGCSSGATPKRIVTGAAGSTDTSGAAGAGNANGAAGADTSGAAGAGNANGAAGADTSGVAGSTADAGADTSTTGAAGDTSGAAGTGAAGTDTSGAAGTPADTSPVLPLPVAISNYWYPSGWDGDQATVAAFTANAASVIVILDKATDGPCAARVAGALGDCFKVTYMPVTADGGVVGHASVALLNNEPNSTTPNYSDLMYAPRPAQGATMVTAEVAGAVGNENVSFDLGAVGATNQSFSPTLTTSWQLLTAPLTGVTYDHVQTPFGWTSSSATPITFYYDDLRFE